MKTSKIYDPKRSEIVAVTCTRILPSVKSTYTHSPGTADFFVAAFPLFTCPKYPSHYFHTLRFPLPLPRWSFPLLFHPRPLQYPFPRPVPCSNPLVFSPVLLYCEYSPSIRSGPCGRGCDENGLILSLSLLCSSRWGRGGVSLGVYLVAGGKLGLARSKDGPP